MGNAFIVAIGSSAGGQRPMLTFFDHTPHDKATYIILRHLPNDYQSQLQSILQNHSKLKVVEVVDGMTIESDTVYMPAKGMYMTIKNNTLYLQGRPLDNLYPNKSIDIFLASLAKAKGKKCIAILLSGSGSDGSTGSCLVKDAGGMVIVQNPESCDYTSMSLHAIKTGSVDYVLNPAEMPAVVLRHVSAVLKNSDEVKRLFKR